MTAVTVVVPTYQRVDLLAEALRSVLAQTFEDFVVLVGDNSEDDATEELVASLDDPRIRYHRNRPGLGPMANWLDLIERAETDLVASLHDDDTWHPDFLAAMVPPMLGDPSIAMAFNDFWIVDQQGHRLGPHTEIESARTHRASLPRGRIAYDRAQGLRLVAVWNACQPAYAAVLRREAVLSVDYGPDIDPLYDIWLSYNLVKNERGLYYEPRRLTNYRVHTRSLTGAGFGPVEDRVFGRILEENADAGPVVQEIVRYWSSLRWSRATRMMAGGRSACQLSQAELLASVAGLAGLKRVVASTAGRSDLAWRMMSLGWALRHRALRREGPGPKEAAASRTAGPRP
jgi:hypothetical protein